MAHYNMGLNPDDLYHNRPAVFKGYAIWKNGDTTEQKVSDYLLFSLIQESQFLDTECNVNSHELDNEYELPDIVVFDFSDGSIAEYNRI